MIRRLALGFSLLCAANLVWLATALPTAAKDDRAARSPKEPYWPQWRGPQRDNISTDSGLLAKWPEGGPPLAWDHKGIGAGFSGLSVVDNRIFTMGDRDGKQYVIALPLDGGNELWSALVGEGWDPGGYSGPRCTPTVDGDRVYAVGSHGDLVCLQTADGKELWRRNFPKDFGGRMHSGWGFSESPLVDGDKLVCTPGGNEAGIVALDKKTGSDIWRAEIPKFGDKGGDGAAYSSIVIGHGAGRKQYVQLIGRGVVGVDAEQGKFLWGYNRVANGTANIPTPLVQGNFVFCSTGYGTGAALVELKPAGDGVQADEVYFKEGKDLQNHHGGMVMLGDYVYLGHGHNQGHPTCVAWKTGEIVWRHDRGPGEGSASVSYADGKLYFRFQNGVLALIAADPKAYEELSVFQLPTSNKPSWPQPVIAGGRLYIREQDSLLCYNVKAE